MKIRPSPSPIALLGFSAVVIVLGLLAPMAWLYAVLLLAAGVYAWWIVSRQTVEPTLVLQALLLFGVIAGLLLPALFSVVELSQESLESLASVRSHATWKALALVVAVLGVSLATVRLWRPGLADRYFLLAAGLLFLAVKLVYVYQVEMEPVSDFRGMWRMATSVSERGHEVATEAQRHIPRLHFERILPYLLPLNLLFGASRWSYVLPNVAVGLLSSLLTYWLARRLLGRAAARAAFLLSLLAPETTLASGIPTHDVPGAFYTLLALALFLVLDDWVAEGGRTGVLVATSLGLGVLLILVDLQRTNRRFLLAAIAILLLARALGAATRRLRRGLVLRQALWLLLVPVAVVGLGESYLESRGFRMDAELRDFWTYRGLAAHTDSWIRGKHREAVDNYYHRYPLPTEAWRELAPRKFASDLHYNPLDRLSSYVRKSLLLFDLGSQHGFYVRGARVRALERAPYRHELTVLASLNREFTIAFLGLLIVGTLKVWCVPRQRTEALVPAVYLALLSGVILLVFQVQPRYLYQIWYLGALYAGAALGGGAEPAGAGESAEPAP